MEASSLFRRNRVSRLTLEQVAQHLEAIGSSRFDVLVLDASTGEPRHLRKSLTAQQVVDAAHWLHRENGEDGEILFRPSDTSQTTHLRGVSEPSLRFAESHGLEPSAVLRGRFGQHEVWMRSSEPLPQEEKAVVDRMLASDFQVQPSPPGPYAGFGHLAGFSSPITRRRAGLEKPPILTLESTSGRIFSLALTLVRSARETVADRRLRLRTDHEVASLERETGLFADFEDGYRSSSLGAGLPAGISGSDAETAVLRLSMMRDAHAEALHAFKEVLSTDASLPDFSGTRAQERFIHTYRAVREAEQPLEHLIQTHPLPPSLSLEDLLRYGELRARLKEAEARTASLEDGEPAARPTRLDEAATQVATLQRELTDFERQHRLPPSVETDSKPNPETPNPSWQKEGRDYTPEPEPDFNRREQRLLIEYEAAKSAYYAPFDPDLPRGIKESRLVDLTMAELELERFEFDQRSVFDGLIQTHDRLAEQLGRAERWDERSDLPGYEAMVEQLSQVDENIRAYEARIARLGRARIDRDLERLEPVLLHRADNADIERYIELGRKRHGLDTAPLPSVRAQRSIANNLNRLTRELETTSVDLGKTREELQRQPRRSTLEDFKRALHEETKAQQKLADAQLIATFRSTSRDLRVAAREMARYRRFSHTVPDHVVASWRDALAAKNAAETAYAARINSAAADRPMPIAKELGRTLGRLRQGDFTPETLARLNLQLSKEIYAIRGVVPEPEKYEAPKNLLQAVEAHRRDRLALLRAARPVDPWRRALLRQAWKLDPNAAHQATPAALEELQKAVTRFQSSAATLNRLAAHRARGPHARVLPYAQFRDHPSFRGAPNRAALAWAAHAVRQGLPADQASELLARISSFRIATPRVASARFGSLLAYYLGRKLARGPERVALEYVRDR